MFNRTLNNRTSLVILNPKGANHNPEVEKSLKVAINQGLEFANLKLLSSNKTAAVEIIKMMNQLPKLNILNLIILIL